LELKSFMRYSPFLIGLGNIDRADDGLGLLVIENLQNQFPDRAFSETDRNVESIVLNLVESHKNISFLFIDATDFGGEPGDIRFFSEDQCENIIPAFSTHKVPLTFLMDHIRRQGGHSGLVAVQPRSLQIFGEITPLIIRAVSDLTIFFSKGLTAVNSV